ncbi:MAG: AAA family ATPase, partial [Vicinamibacterales bacterium]
MRPPGFPLAALVGLETLKTALQLAAIDCRLSVLIRGDKGAGKSTAARGLADVLAKDTSFVNLPIGATDDRLLGGLDIAKALKGEPALKPGLLHEAHGGVLYVDEVNLLPDHLADALLDAVASGVHIVEREGFSVAQHAEFVMVGSMNPEEGALRPQLLDRFAFAVDVVAPVEPLVRCEVIARRLAYDADPVVFADAWREAQAELARQLDEARGRLGDVALPREMLAFIAERIAEHAVCSLRADLAVVRGSRALAALEGTPAIGAQHVEAVLPLALAHRTSARPQHPQPPSPPPRASEQLQDAGGAGDAGTERVFAPIDVQAPRLVAHQTSKASGTSADVSGGRDGEAIGTRRTLEPRELDPRETFRHALERSGAADIVAEDLHERVRLPRAGRRYIFVVDSSGSHAIHQRMRVVKGAINGVLDRTHARRDEIAVIVCRGAAAQIVMEPTPVVADVRRALEYLPTGGRTPLAHALELAAGYVTDASAVVVLTDGHANVPSRTADPWADALSAARALAAPALVIDSEDAQEATGRPRQLADA